MENIGNKYSKQLSRKEINYIYKVLEQYNFKVHNCTKVRSVYKIQTSNGVLCLKKIKHGQHKPNNGNILVQELFHRGFHNIAKYYKTREGKSYVRYKKMFFYVTEWIEGEESNLNDINEAVNCIKLLAKFHLTAMDIDITKLKIKNNLKNWPKKFNKNLRDLEKFQKIIDKKKIKNEFDILYCNYLESFYYKGMISLNLLNTSEYYRLSNQSNKNNGLCHNSFYYKNLIKKDDKYYLIDLDSILIDFHVNDLGKLIRRLMFKRSYKWDFSKIKIFIESYNSINKLNKSELEIMLAFMTFPHKFCKLGKRRYLKRKAWDESKYLHKLNKLIKYNELQNKFLEDFLEFINQYN